MRAEIYNSILLCKHQVTCIQIFNETAFIVWRLAWLVFAMARKFPKNAIYL